MAFPASSPPCLPFLLPLLDVLPSLTGIPSLQAGLAIIWVTADFVAICVSREQRGIHPGAHVALHLIIWLLAAVTVGFLGFYISYSYGSDTGTSEYFAPTGFKILLIERTLLAFSCLLLLTHFILFVRACIETHQYNMYGSTVYVPIALSLIHI